VVVVFGSGSPFSRTPAPAPRVDTGLPEALSRLDTNNGAVRIGFGLVLFATGAVLLYFTLVNPVFDPALGQRSPIDERTAAVEVSSAGEYVVYLETAECQTEDVVLQRVGEDPAPVAPFAGPDFVRYWYDDRCGEPIGTASLPSAGLWTATFATVDAGDLTVYPADAPPTSLDWELSWLFGPALVIGLALLVQGTIEHVRWRRSLRQPSV
jgi:hypothetical protein